MNYPDWFDKVSPIVMHDPLSQLLGAITDGKITYNYIDMVKLAGHSCPTVAGAWIMCDLGLKDLFGETIPTRGNIKIEMAEALDEGVTGVVAQCLSLISGGANEGGFKGLGSAYARNNRLFFSCNIPGEVRLTRLDTDRSISMTYDPSSIPFHPQMKPLMQKTRQGTLSDEERAFFAEEWQNRVKKILTRTTDWTQLVTIT